MSGYTPGPTPSPRQRIFRLVAEYARANGVRESSVWAQLYRKFEDKTGVLWRKVAHNSGQSVLNTIAGEGRSVELLELASEFLAEGVKP